jgi:hypothetical protein
MIKRLAFVLATLLLRGTAFAVQPTECVSAQQRLEHIFPLAQTSRAIAAKKFTVLVVGTGSSTLPGPKGARLAYPARLQQALTEALPGVAVKVATEVKAHRNAAAMVKTLKAALAVTRPALMIWQSGTVDAMQATDPGQFADTLEEGIDIARAAGTDVILVNSQYSPRTESMIALGTYIDEMRWVALQHEVQLFNRFEIMRAWADLGTFDFTSARDKLAMAGRVHACIGWLLADLVTEAVKPDEPQTEGAR